MRLAFGELGDQGLPVRLGRKGVGRKGFPACLWGKGVGRKGVLACFAGRVLGGRVFPLALKAGFIAPDVTAALRTKHVKGGLECKPSAEAKHNRTKSKPRGSTFR